MPYRRLLAPVLVSLALLGAACAAEEADPASSPEAAPTTAQKPDVAEPSESDATPTTTEDQPTVRSEEPTPSAETEEPDRTDQAVSLDEDAANTGRAEQVAGTLRERSFRQFVPSRDASPRRAVIVSFFSGVSVWAQYAEDGHALHEWEVVADEFQVIAGSSDSEFAIRLVEPFTKQILPAKCNDCIDASGLSVSVRNVFDPDLIAFRLNGPEGGLPPAVPCVRAMDTVQRRRVDELTRWRMRAPVSPRLSHRQPNTAADHPSGGESVGRCRCRTLRRAQRRGSGAVPTRWRAPQRTRRLR